MWLMIHSWQKLLKLRLNESENNWNMTYFWITEWDVRYIIKAEVPDEVCTVKTSPGLTGIFGRSSQLIEFFFPRFSPLIMIFFKKTCYSIVTPFRRTCSRLREISHLLLCVFRPRCRGICAWKHLLRLQKLPQHFKDGSILPVNRHLLIWNCYFGHNTRLSSYVAGPSCSLASHVCDGWRV